MDAIYLPQLANAPKRTEVVQFEEFLPELDTLTPVKGKLQVVHQGNYLEVSVEAEAIITLSCHRCLQHYNHRLALQTSELIWLEESVDEPVDLEREIPFEDLLETLSPRGHFQPTEWLYEQMCLAIPQRQLCDQKCAGIPISPEISQPSIDGRWASLEALKRQLG